MGAKCKNCTSLRDQRNVLAGALQRVKNRMDVNEAVGFSVDDYEAVEAVLADWETTKCPVCHQMAVDQKSDDNGIYWECAHCGWGDYDD